MIGRVTQEGAIIRRRLSSRSLFQAELKAHFHGEGSGARIDCRTGPSLLSAIVATVWLGYVLFVACALGLLAMTGDMKPAPGVPKVFVELFPLIVAGFAVAIVLTGRWVVRRDTRLLGEFLARRLDTASVEAAE